MRLFVGGMILLLSDSAILMMAAMPEAGMQWPIIDFTLPISQLAIFAVAAIVVGVIAAIFPARRAARLNVLQALQYE